MINVVSLKLFNEFDETIWTATFLLLLMEQVALSKYLHFNTKHPEIPIETVRILNKVKLNKLEKTKLKEKKNNKVIKKILSNYNVDFLSQWIQSINFKVWMNEHDRNICLRSNYISYASNVQVVYENFFEKSKISIEQS